MKALILIVIFFALLIAGTINAHRTQTNAPVAAPVPVECSHIWTKWSEPDIKADWFSGTRIYQARKCEKCGLAEVTRVQVSAGH